MNDNVLIALIVVIGVVFVLVSALWIFKDRLDIFNFTASKKIVSAKMARHQNTEITISNNIQAGNDNEISAEISGATIENNRQEGDKNQIRVVAAAKSNKNKN